MNAKDLRKLVRRQMAWELLPPRSRNVNIDGNICWLEAEDEIDAGQWTHPRSERTLIWSDLHLHHGAIIEHGRRPFWNCSQMNNHLWERWEKAATAGTTVICAGDVAWPGTLTASEQARIRSMPGRNVLVIGNHDFGEKGTIAQTGMDETLSVLVIDADPCLLITHMPLNEVPANCVNVHGHIHNTRPLPRTRHVNVAVEQLEYQPADLEDILVLAKTLANGRVPPGDTTTERIEVATGRKKQPQTWWNWP